MLGNPVPGRIQAKEEAWLGTPSFRVTATFADHAGRALGIDIGNGRQGDDVYAMADGTVQFAGGVMVTGMPSAALVVRVRHPQFDAQFGGQVVTGYAHLQSYAVTIGARVTRGQVIGKVGMTGATAPHLHGGFTVNNVERDWWPLLDQNIQEDVVAPGTKRIGPPIGTFAWTGTGHLLLSPSDPVGLRFPQSANPGPFSVIASLDLVTADAGLPVDIDGKSPPQNNRDEVYLVDPGRGASCYVLRADGTFTANGTGDPGAAAQAVADAAQAEADKHK